MNVIAKKRIIYMKHQDKKKNFNKVYILLFLLIITLTLVNFDWITKDERPPSLEDLILLGNLPKLYYNRLYDLELYNKLFLLPYPPFIPFLILISFKIFGPSFDSALYVNLFFWPVLTLSCFFLGKKLYNEKVGLLTAFILSTLPPIILLSRSTYDQFILVSLVTLNFALFAYTDWFKNRKFSIMYGFSFALCLLTRYTSLPYIIVPPIFFVFFKLDLFKKLFYIKKLFKLKPKLNKKDTIIILMKAIIVLTTLCLTFFFNKFYLNNILFIFLVLYFLLVTLIILTKKSIINNFIDSIIIALILTLPWYTINFISLIRMNLTQFNDFILQNTLTITDKIFYYIIFLINWQIGIINFLIFIIIIIFLFMKYYKKRKIDEKDLLFFLIFLIPYIFYTLISLKNWLVTTSLLIPISLIIAKGIFESPKIIKYVFLLIVISGGLFYLLPFQELNRTIAFEYECLRIDNFPFKDNHYLIIFSKDNDFSLEFSRNSRFYLLRNEQEIKEIANVIYSIAKNKNLKETKILFLFSDDYVYPNCLDYHLTFMDINSLSFLCDLPNFYDQDQLYVPTNLSYTQNNEKDFEWVYNFDFVLIPDTINNDKISDTFYDDYLFGKNCFAIYSYISDSEKFNNKFRLVYKTKISDKKIIMMYEKI